MTYYRVRQEYDQLPQDAKVRDGNILVANELFTKAELKKLPFVCTKVFERVKIPKNQTYLFFGARFERRESPFTKTPILNGGI